MPEPREIVVKGCGYRCPLFNGDYGTCGIDPRERYAGYVLGIPEWCPLRSGPITIGMQADVQNYSRKNDRTTLGGFKL